MAEGCRGDVVPEEPQDIRLASSLQVRQHRQMPRQMPARRDCQVDGSLSFAAPSVQDTRTTLDDQYFYKSAGEDKVVPAFANGDDRLEVGEREKGLLVKLERGKAQMIALESGLLQLVHPPAVSIADDFNGHRSAFKTRTSMTHPEGFRGPEVEALMQQAIAGFLLPGDHGYHNSINSDEEDQEDMSVMIVEARNSIHEFGMDKTKGIVAPPRDPNQMIDGEPIFKKGSEVIVMIVVGGVSQTYKAALQAKVSCGIGSLLLKAAVLTHRGKPLRLLSYGFLV